MFGKNGGKELAEKHDVPFLGEIPIVQSIREGGDIGYPSILNNDATAKSFEKLAEALAQQVAIRNAQQEETLKVAIKA